MTHCRSCAIIGQTCFWEHYVTDRPQEIEAFYWLLIRVGVMAFGYLMMIGGGLFALTYASEKLRTGAVEFGGATDPSLAGALWLTVLPGALALVGFGLVRWMRHLSVKNAS